MRVRRMGRVFHGCTGWVRRHPRISFLVLLVGISSLSGLAVLFQQRILAARQHWDQADEKLSHYDFAAARGELTEFLRMRPGDAQAHFRLAQACRRDSHEDFKVAEEHLQAAYVSGYSAAEINLENR